MSTSTALPLVSSDTTKKRRRPAGTPDPDAEVVSLSPQTLLESDRYVCEICSQAFQREQNLQMHRRRHKVPWKLVRKETAAAAGASAGTGAGAGEARKRVYVCPEPSCLHHEPGHALGDLVGIKKHFRRKHSDRRQWVCERCDKGYAVQSDYKAHLKTCGTRGHTCDCGRVFSRVESFIEHQDACAARGSSQPACLSRTGSSSSPSTDTDYSNAAAPIAPTWPNLSISSAASRNPKLELQLLPAFTSKPNTVTASPSTDESHAATAQLQLSLAPAGGRTGNVDQEALPNRLRAAAAEKALADEARRQAKRQLELAQQEFARAVRIRQQAQAELDRAYMLRNDAAKSVNSVLQFTCHQCKNRLRPNDNSLASSAVSDGEKSRNSV